MLISLARSHHSNSHSHTFLIDRKYLWFFSLAIVRFVMKKSSWHCYYQYISRSLLSRTTCAIVFVLNLSLTLTSIIRLQKKTHKTIFDINMSIFCWFCFHCVFSYGSDICRKWILFISSISLCAHHMVNSLNNLFCSSHSHAYSFSMFLCVCLFYFLVRYKAWLRTEACRE